MVRRIAISLPLSLNQHDKARDDIQRPRTRTIMVEDQKHHVAARPEARWKKVDCCACRQSTRNNRSSGRALRSPSCDRTSILSGLVVKHPSIAVTSFGDD